MSESASQNNTLINAIGAQLPWKRDQSGCAVLDMKDLASLTSVQLQLVKACRENKWFVLFRSPTLRVNFLAATSQDLLEAINQGQGWTGDQAANKIALAEGAKKMAASTDKPAWDATKTNISAEELLRRSAGKPPGRPRG